MSKKTVLLADGANFTNNYKSNLGGVDAVLVETSNVHGLMSNISSNGGIDVLVMGDDSLGVDAALLVSEIRKLAPKLPIILATQTLTEQQAKDMGADQAYNRSTQRLPELKDMIGQYLSQ